MCHGAGCLVLAKPRKHTPLQTFAWLRPRDERCGRLGVGRAREKPNRLGRQRRVCCRCGPQVLGNMHGHGKRLWVRSFVNHAAGAHNARPLAKRLRWSDTGSSCLGGCRKVNKKKKRERESVCVCGWVRESVCMCVRVCVRVWLAGVSAHICVCLCLCEQSERWTRKQVQTISKHSGEGRQRTVCGQRGS